MKASDFTTKDFLRHDSPAAKEEMEILTKATVGSVRKCQLYPALPVSIEWTCTKAEPKMWEYEGRFFGQPICRLEIEVQAQLLTLTVKEV